MAGNQQYVKRNASFVQRHAQRINIIVMGITCIVIAAPMFYAGHVRNYVDLKGGKVVPAVSTEKESK